jgi:hypothetical protein
MFGFLFGKKRDRIILPTSLIYAHQQAKWDKIINVLEYESETHIMFFDELEKKELEGELDKMGIDYKSTNSIQFHNLNFPERVRFINQHSKIIFIDHAASFVSEQKALRHLKNNCSIIQFDFYISLEDRILKENLGDNFINLMRQLEIQDNEEITHKSINQAIARIQQKKDKDENINN